VNQLKEHTCADYFHGCTCSIIADEPADDCDVHGAGHWPPRCICGKLVKWKERIHHEQKGE